jgi:hypothetical protein
VLELFVLTVHDELCLGAIAAKIFEMMPLLGSNLFKEPNLMRLVIHDLLDLRSVG